VIRRASSPVLVGRDGELRLLVEAVLEPPSGTPAVVLVAGEAGVGKSRLVHEFAALARGRGVRVLEGACPAFAGDTLPYAALVDVLHQLAQRADPATLSRLLGSDRGELARLVPEFGADPTIAAPDRANRARLLEAVRNLFARLAAGSQRYVVLIEDLHWASLAGLELFNFLLHARPGGLGIVTTYRSDDPPPRHPLRPILAELHRLDNVEHVELGRLSLSDVTALLASITGSRPGVDWATRVFAQSDGIPFFVEELVAAAPEHEHGGIPQRLHDVLNPRLLRLTASGRDVVRVAAVAGRHVDHRLLHAVAGLPERRLEAGLRDALDEHVLVLSAEGEGYEFRHALMREAVYSQLLPGERARTHARYARQLVSNPRVGDDVLRAAEIAQHFSAAGEAGPALAWSVRAGRAAEAVYAFAEALHQYRRALQLWPTVPDAAAVSGASRSALLADAIRVADFAGDYTVGLELIDRALALPDREVLPEGVLRERRAWYLSMSGGSFPVALEACRTAVECVPVSPPTRERARVLATYGWLLAACGRFSEAIPLCDEALAIARELGDEHEVARAQAGRAVALPPTGDPAEGLAAGREACDISARLGSLEMLGATHVLVTITRLSFDRRLGDVVDDALSASDLLCRLGFAAADARVPAQPGGRRALRAGAMGRSRRPGGGDGGAERVRHGAGVGDLPGPG
jgi:tetratricopeptide (TPR) repeat protein